MSGAGREKDPPAVSMSQPDHARWCPWSTVPFYAPFLNGAIRSCDPKIGLLLSSVIVAAIERDPGSATPVRPCTRWRGGNIPTERIYRRFLDGVEPFPIDTIPY